MYMYVVCDVEVITMKVQCTLA